MMHSRVIAIAGSLALLLGGAACGPFGGDDAANVSAPTSTAQTAAAPAIPTGPPSPVAEVIEPTKQPGGKIGAPAQPTSNLPQYQQPKRRPLAIMIENHPNARPQSGLHKADVVYEAPAEFGVPRFMAIYVNNDAPTLGPVRSARGYFVTWASEYDPTYVHAGGSPEALSFIKQLKVRDIDALRYGGGGFERTSDRVAPHNLYTDTAELRKVIGKDKALRGGGRGKWGGLVFSDKPTVGAEEGLEVTLTYEGGYNVTYYYDERSGTYKREMVGEPHMDRETKRQIAASAVVIQSIGMFKVKGDAYGRLQAQVKDEQAPVLIFQNGRVIEGYWRKDRRPSPTMYTTKDGKPILLKPGQVWIQMAPKQTAKIEVK